MADEKTGRIRLHKWNFNNPGLHCVDCGKEFHAGDISVWWGENFSSSPDAHAHCRPYEYTLAVLAGEEVHESPF